MGLGKDNPIPQGISKADAYEKIRSWYQANISLIDDHEENYYEESREYIRNLKPLESVSEEEMDEVFNEVRTGLLEWAYHQSDGEYKMAAYAISASE